MIIADQNIQLSARHYAMAETQKERVHETYQNGQLATREKISSHTQHEIFRASESALNLNKTAPNTLQANQHQERFPTLNERSFADQQGSPFKALPRPLTQTLAQGETANSVENSVQLSPRLIKMIEAIESLMERMTGKPYTMKVMGYTPETEVGKQATPPSGSHNPTIESNSKPGFSRTLEPTVTGERITESYTYQEHEFSSFKAQGSITTADGSTIQFDFNAAMHRNFATSIQAEQTKGFVVTDPLVVNFGGSPARLTLNKIEFDLNSDGQQDNISFLEGGSGFLALDKNQDGVINNGQELFGTQSGNGFKDLAEYDSDQNGWIDENDAIFSQLQIWHKDDNGLNQLSGLLELNIGAIYLQNQETQFSIKDSNNTLLGQVVKTGLFMGENQQVGSVQQIDLVI